MHKAAFLGLAPIALSSGYTDGVSVDNIRRCLRIGIVSAECRMLSLFLRSQWPRPLRLVVGKSRLVFCAALAAIKRAQSPSNDGATSLCICRRVASALSARGHLLLRRGTHAKSAITGAKLRLRGPSAHHWHNKYLLSAEEPPCGGLRPNSREMGRVVVVVVVVAAVIGGCSIV